MQPPLAVIKRTGLLAFSKTWGERRPFFTRFTSAPVSIKTFNTLPEPSLKIAFKRRYSCQTFLWRMWRHLFRGILPGGPLNLSGTWKVLSGFSESGQMYSWKLSTCSGVSKNCASSMFSKGKTPSRSFASHGVFSEKLREEHSMKEAEFSEKLAQVASEFFKTVP